MEPLTDEAFHHRMRADAATELERVKTLVLIMPPQLLELDSRAAALEGLIRQYDAYLTSLKSGSASVKG